MLLSQNHDNAGLLATLGTMYLQTGKYGLAIHFLEAASKNRKQSDVLSIYCLQKLGADGQGDFLRREGLQDCRAKRRGVSELLRFLHQHRDSRQSNPPV
jgi:uncharacterized protein HemY